MVERSLTQKGIAALKNGNCQEAGRLLSEAVRQNPQDEIAWLGLAVCIDDPAKKKYCLQKVLAINPNNEAAGRMLAKQEATPAPASRPLRGNVPEQGGLLSGRPSELVESPAENPPAETVPPFDLRGKLQEEIHPPRPIPVRKHPPVSRARRILAALVIGLFLVAAVVIGGWFIYVHYYQAPAGVEPAVNLPGNLISALASPQAGTAVAGEENALPLAGGGLKQLQSIGAGKILDIAMVPGSNRLVIATGLGITVVDLEGWNDGAPVLVRTIPTHKPVVNVAISPDGSRAAAILQRSASSLQEIRIWNLEDGGLVAEMDTAAHLDENGRLLYDPRTAQVDSVSFTPDGKRLAGRRSPLTYWDTASGHFLNFGLDGRANSRIVFSPGDLSYATCEDVEVVLWDVASEAEIKSFPVSGETSVDGCGGELAFSHDGLLLASANLNGTVDVWELQSGQRLNLAGLPANDQDETVPGNAAAFSPDGTRLAMSFGNTVALWRLSDGALLGQQETTETVANILFSHNNASILTLGDGALRLRQVDDLSLMATLPGYEDYSQALLSPDSQFLAVVLPEGGVRIVRLQDGAPLGTLGSGYGLRLLGFSPDSKRIAVRSQNLEIWLLSGGLETNLDLPGEIIAVSPDWDTVLTLQNDTVNVFKLPDGSPAWTKSFPGSLQINAGYTQNGSVIISSGQDWQFFDPTGGQMLYTLPAGTAFDRITFSPDRQFMVYGNGLEATLRRVTDGAQTLAFSLDDENASFSFTPDGRFLLVCAPSGLSTVNVANGDVASIGQGCIQGVLSPDGNELACYDENAGKLRLIQIYFSADSPELGRIDADAVNATLAQIGFLPQKHQFLGLSQDGVAHRWQLP